MPDGFKVADAFVDVTLNLDGAAIENAARRVGERASDSIKSSLGQGGKGGGEEFAKSFTGSAESRMRDSRGRFVSTFDGIGDGAGKSSGGKFAGSFGGSLLGGVAGIGAKMTGLLGGALGAVTEKASPQMIAGIVGAVGVAAPLAGAVLGGALTAGVALAGIGIGVAAAMRVPAVKGAAVELKGTIMGEVGKIGQEWAPTMIGAIGQIKAAVPGIGANLRAALAPAQGYVKPLVDGFLGLTRNVLPGFNNLLREAGPVIGALRDGLMRIGTAISNAFTSMSGSTDEMAAGLQFTIGLLSKGVEFAGAMIGWFAKGFKYVIDFVQPIVELASHIPGIGGEFARWNEALKSVQATAHGVNPALSLAGSNMTTLSGATSKASASSESMATRQRILNGTLAEGADAAGDLKAAMDALNGAAQSAEEAEIGYRESVKAATAALKENGATTDLNSEKGQNNRRVLLDLARAGQTRAQAQYDQTAATRGTSAAEQVAQRSYAESRSALIAAATQMFKSRSAAVAYADRIMAIPKAWNTNVKVNTGDATSRLSAVKGYIASLRSKDIHVRVHVSKHGETLHGGQASAYMSRGGPVTGPGVRGVDSVRTVLAPGEHVLTDKEVIAAGGHNAIMAFRKSLLAGGKMTAPSMTAVGAVRDPEGLKPPAPPKIPSRPVPSFPDIKKPRDTDLWDRADKPGETGGGSGGGSGGGGDTIYIDNLTITVDPAQIRSIQQLAELLSGITVSARSFQTRTSTAGAR